MGVGDFCFACSPTFVFSCRSKLGINEQGSTLRLLLGDLIPIH